MRVRDIMVQGARTCHADDSLDYAAQIMWENDCGCVPVVNEDGKPIAMITDRDICMAAYTQRQPLTHIFVASAASHNIFTTHENDCIDSAEGLMRRHQIRRLPVVDECGRAIGILSMNDIIRNAHVHDRRDEGLKSETIVSTLGAICQPNAARVAA
jgi:CBS domain-containing protein